jgi:hypothetical protein
VGERGQGFFDGEAGPEFPDRRAKLFLGVDGQMARRRQISADAGSVAPRETLRTMAFWTGTGSRSPPSDPTCPTPLPLITIGCCVNLFIPTEVPCETFHLRARRIPLDGHFS